MSLLFLVAAQVLAFTPVQPKNAESGLVCRVLRHPREHMGQTFTFTGRFYYGVHGVYFLLAERCGGDVSIPAVGWVPPRIHGRDNPLFKAEGRIVIDRRTFGKPAEVVAFSIAHIEEVPVFLYPPTQ